VPHAGEQLATQVFDQAEAEAGEHERPRWRVAVLDRPLRGPRAGAEAPQRTADTPENPEV
jgi:hypothetical protein